MLLAFTYWLACLSDPDAPSPEPEGFLEVLEVETGGGVVSATEVVKGRNPGCRWGREAWRFEDGHVYVQNDVLCSGRAKNEAYGCQVRAMAEAPFDAQRGVYTVPHRVDARGRFVGDRTSAIDPGERAHCAVSIVAGEYPVTRVRNGRWKWEIRTPAGMVLRVLDTDGKVDFGFALEQSEAEAAP